MSLNITKLVDGHRDTQNHGEAHLISTKLKTKQLNVYSLNRLAFVWLDEISVADFFLPDFIFVVALSWSCVKNDLDDFSALFSSMAVSLP